ncbi:hypothetical protein ACFU9V_14690, partial [Streptomyces sp. NPDC057557]
APAAWMAAGPPPRPGAPRGALPAPPPPPGAGGGGAFGALVATGFEDGLRTSLAISAALLTLTALATTRLARGGPAAPSKDSD